MTECCNDLDLFVDRELAPEAADAFRDHLATCTRCQDALEGRMQEAALLVNQRARHHSYPPTPRTPPPGIHGPTNPAADLIELRARKPTERADVAPSFETTAKPGDTEPKASATEIIAIPRRRRAKLRAPTIAALIASAGGVAAAMSVAMLGMQTPPPVASLLPQRRVEVRFSAPELDQFRELYVVRGAVESPYEHISLQYLYGLESHHELNTLVGAHALTGNFSSAEQTARSLEPTADGLSDLAAIELMKVSGQKAPAERELGAQRALSLAHDALLLEKTHAQAAWNHGLALRALDLPLVAERVFGELAKRGEPGWSTEAAAKAKELHNAHASWDRWLKRKHEARKMALGGAILVQSESTDPGEQLPPSLLRDELYLAIATAATPERFDALAPSARAVDSALATTSLSALLAELRRSNLAARAPLARDLADALRDADPQAALAKVRVRATAVGVPDIALATFVASKPSELDASDLAQLDRLLDGSHDPWWQLFQLERHAYAAEYIRRDYAAVDAIARQAAPICATIHSGSCIRITRIAGSAAGSMGRIDDAIKQLADARQRARDANLLDDEVAAIYAIGQLMAVRLTDQLDSSAVADAYLEEAELRWQTCGPSLQRLDFEASSALLYHRFGDAQDARHRADDLEGGKCTDSAPRFNGETARAQLALQRRDADQRGRLQGHVDRLRKAAPESYALWLDYLAAVDQLLGEPGAGELALRAVIRAATDGPSRPYAPMVRDVAFDALVDNVATEGRGDEVLALLAERVRVPDGARCVLGVASWNRVVVAARDARGQVALETLAIPRGVLRLPASAVVSPAIRKQLADCPRIQVLAPGPYFGAPRLLGDDVAWSYRSGGATIEPPAASAHELVVSDVTPPDQLQLPRLRRFEPSAGGELLSGMAATPERVLERMTNASLIVIVAHGFTDVSEPSAASLVLSASASGDYLLTASKVQAARLTRAPIVVLAGCDVGRVQVTNQPWSLATSFLRAGARTVIAPTEPIPDDSADDVFRGLVDRVRAGEDPAVVLANERRQPGSKASWISSIVVFDR